jgi:hypothetical protein
MTLWQRLLDRVAPLAAEDVSNLDRLDGIAGTAPQPTPRRVPQPPPATTQRSPIAPDPQTGGAVTYPDPPRG